MPLLVEPASRISKNDFAASSVSFLLILLTVILLYSPALKIGYEADDFQIFTALESSEFSLLDPFPVGTGTFFRPLAHLTLLIEHRWVADQTGTLHHMANVLMHALNAVLVYLTCRLISARWRLSLGLALLFVAHPASITPVFRITDRSTLLLAFFYLGAVYCFIRFLKGGHSYWLFLTGLAVVGNLLSKEAGATLVLALGIIFVLYRFWLNVAASTSALRAKKALVALAVYALLSASYGVFLYVYIYRESSYIVTAASIGSIAQQLGAFAVFFLVPNNEILFSTLYDEFPAYIVAAGLALLLITGAAAIWTYKRAGFRRLMLAFLLALLVLLPVLPQLLIAGMSSRHLYLSLAMFSISIACWWAAAVRSPTRYFYILLPIIALAALGTYHHGSVRVANWHAYEYACDSFRTLMANAPDDPGIVIFAYPFSYHSAPLLSNDGSSALYHCQYGQFGQFNRFKPVSPLFTYTKTPLQEIVVLDQPESGVYTLSLISSDAFFRSEPRRGYRGATPESSLSYESNHSLGNGRSAGLVVEISKPEAFQDIYFLYFDGREFQVLPPSP